MTAAIVALTIAGASLPAAAQTSSAVGTLLTNGTTLTQSVGTLSGNVQQLNTSLIYLQGKLALPGKLASDLKQLDSLLTTSKTLLEAASIIPDLQSATSVMLDGISATQPPVQSAQTTATQFDDSVQPISDPVNALQGTVNTLSTDLTKFQQGLAQYLNAVRVAQQCVAGQPAASRQTLQNALDTLANGSSKTMADMNVAAGATNATVGTLQQTAQNTLAPVFEPVNTLENDVAALFKSLQGIEGPLNDVGSVLKKNFSVTFPYPNPSWSHPFRISHYTLNIRMTTIIAGAAKIEAEIESILRGFLYRMAKLFGLERLIDDLSSAANSEMKKVLDTLHLDFKVNIPGLSTFQNDLGSVTTRFQNVAPGLKLDTSALDTPLHTLSANFGQLNQLGSCGAAASSAPRPAPAPAPSPTGGIPWPPTSPIHIGPPLPPLPSTPTFPGGIPRFPGGNPGPF